VHDSDSVQVTETNFLFMVLGPLLIFGIAELVYPHHENGPPSQSVIMITNQARHI